MEQIRNGNPIGFPSHVPPPSLSRGMPEGRDTTDSGGPFTLHPPLPFGALRGLAPQGATIPLETFAFSSLYSSAMNTSNKGIESFPHLSNSMYSAGSTSSRPISCPTNAVGPGRSFSQDIGSGYAPQSILHQGFEMNAVGTHMPVRLSSSPNNFSYTNHTQTGSCFSQSKLSGMTNPTGTSMLWGSGMNPYSSEGYSGDQTLANRIANSLSKYRSVPIKRKSDADLGSPMKVYLSENKMAARMENLTISDNKQTVSVSMKEIEDRLSDDEDGDLVEDKDHQVKLSKDLKDKLTKQAKDEILPKSILENIAAFSCKPRMEIVLWKPPGGLVSDFIAKPSVEAESTEESTANISSEQTQSAEMSMDASDEVLPDAKTGSDTIWVMPETLVPQVGASPASLAQPLGFVQPADMSQAAMDARAVLAGVQPESMVAMNLMAMPSVGAAQGSAPFMTDTFAADMNAAATAAVSQPPVAPAPAQHQFQEDNNNVISQQDLFDALDDEMDL